jgi:hypothetical protein
VNSHGELSRRRANVVGLDLDSLAPAKVGHLVHELELA